MNFLDLKDIAERHLEIVDPISPAKLLRVGEVMDSFQPVRVGSQAPQEGCEGGPVAVFGRVLVADHGLSHGAVPAAIFSRMRSVMTWATSGLGWRVIGIGPPPHRQALGASLPATR